MPEKIKSYMCNLERVQDAVDVGCQLPWSQRFWFVLSTLIHWIVIYSVDSINHVSSNGGQGFNFEP